MQNLKNKNDKPFKGTTRLGKRLIAGAEEVLAHVRGEIKLESYRLPVSGGGREREKKQ